MARAPIYAGGGIVVRGRKRPRVAVVQRSKDDRWVLPRGKLKRNEPPVAGALREVIEETGHRAKVQDFVGSMAYRTGGRAKIVLFWRMQAAKKPARDISKDIAAVDWLPLTAAVRRLSFPLEKLFLDQTGRQALRRKRKKKSGARKRAAARRRVLSSAKKPKTSSRTKASKKRRGSTTKGRSTKASRRKRL